MANVYRILKTTLDDIADAIRAKTGSSSSMTPAQMVTEIAAIPSGGSLPSSVTAIAGGSFTLAADTGANQYSIPHSMPSVPRRFVIWTEDAFDDSSNTSTTLYLVNTLVSRESVVAASGTFALGYSYIYYRHSDKRVSVNNGSRTEAQASGYLGADFIKMNDSTVKYQAGKTYKWLAWA